MQTYGTSYSPAFSGEIRVPIDKIPPPPLDERKLIARRCAFELPWGGVIRTRGGLCSPLSDAYFEMVSGLQTKGCSFPAGFCGWL